MNFKLGTIFFSLLIVFTISFVGCGYKLREISQGLSGQTISVFFQNNAFNLSFVNQLKLQGGVKKIYFNKISEESDISINILEHETTRYSVALGTGARTKEARLEYFLKISLSKQGDEKELILEIRDESNYPFDESKILAIEEIEKRLNENFFSNAISRINFSLLDLRYEDTPN